MVTLPTLSTPFDCSRSCPRFERVDVCRFSALFAAAGVRAVVSSHTVKLEIRLSNVDALRDAVAELGGKFIGAGSHKLYQREAVDGVAFSLPGWIYPLVATAGGSLAFDDYGGKWGNVADVDRIRAEYTFAAAKRCADALGWMNERTPAGALIVHHPAGGSLTIDAAGGIDANGFNGAGCHEAASTIGASIGRPIEFIAKAEFYNAEQRLTAGG